MRLRFLTAVVLCGLAGGAAAQDTLRAEVARPLLAARSALQAHNYARATAAVRQAEAVGGKTPRENAVIAQMKAAIAAASGDAALASQLLQSGEVSGADAQKLMANLVGASFRTRNYANAAYWADRYIKAGGPDPRMRGYLVQAYYLQGNYAEAQRLQAAQIAAETRAGRAPKEEQLQLLYNCQQHTGDKVGQLATMKQLITYYPKPDYWLNVINNLRAEPGFADRLLLDIYRLEFSLGLVNKPADAMDYAELALQAKLPGEAKSVVDRSYAGGLLGTGPEAPREERLRALVNKTYADMQKQLGRDDADAATDHDGNRLASLAETYISFGNYAKGIPMLEQALHKDDLRHPEDVKLQLGLAYLNSGNKAKAVSVLRTVGGKEGAADLAQLWILRSRT